MNTTQRHHSDKARAIARRGYFVGVVRFAFDAFLFSVTVGIWGFILAMFALKWVMP